MSPITDPRRRRSTLIIKSAAVAAAAAAAGAIFSLRPRDPTFQLISINLSSFHLNFPLLDLTLTLALHITNPNIVSIRYSPATVSIFYAQSLLGRADLGPGSQPAFSCRLLHLPARLSGLQIAHNAAGILADVARRRMSLDAAVEIAGEACVLLWRCCFRLKLQSRVLVDPVLLDVVDQVNHAETCL